KAAKVNDAALGSKIDRIITPLAEASVRMRGKPGRPPRYFSKLPPEISKALGPILDDVPTNARRPLAAKASRTVEATTDDVFNAAPSSAGSQLLSVKETARHLNLSTDTIYARS